jgi:phosphate-selective porin O/P
MRISTFCVALVCFVCVGRSALAQVTPASTSTPPDDTPSIKVGAVIYPDFTYQVNPTITDTDGNITHLNQFNVTRAYINITGNLSHIIAFRVTPDVSRETSSFSTLAGSLEFRIKYAYAQFNLDDWMTKGSYARLGIQQTPWLDFAEGIYRYRFQGTMFVEREGYFASADGGASFHYQLPSNYGDVHVGVFNGENYNKAEVNNEKAVMIRGSIRPFANPSSAPVLRGLRAHVFYDADAYVKDGPRNRFIGSLTFEHQYLNAGFEFLDTADRTSITKPEVDGRGYSIWATPRSPKGFEALLRYDHLEPNTSLSAQTRNRTIFGVAYWFPHQGAVTSALLVDYDSQTFDNFLPAQPKQTKVGVHGLISF